jgi:hypothetical protein
MMEISMKYICKNRGYLKIIKKKVLEFRIFLMVIAVKYNQKCLGIMEK